VPHRVRAHLRGQHGDPVVNVGRPDITYGPVAPIREHVVGGPLVIGVPARSTNPSSVGPPVVVEPKRSLPKIPGNECAAHELRLHRAFPLERGSRRPLGSSTAKTLGALLAGALPVTQIPTTGPVPKTRHGPTPL
jgi:hypothetical protein